MKLGIHTFPKSEISNAKEFSIDLATWHLGDSQGICFHSRVVRFISSISVEDWQTINSMNGTFQSSSK